jgi:hypothetical protein
VKSEAANLENFLLVAFDILPADIVKKAGEKFVLGIGIDGRAVAVF